MKELVGQGKPFYSAVDKAAGLLKRKAGTGSEFMKELMALPGIKQSEIAERGLGDIMGAPKMTHEQFMSALAAKPAPAIREKVLGEEPSPSEVRKQASQMMKNMAEEYAADGAETSKEYRSIKADELRRMRNVGMMDTLLDSARHDLYKEPHHEQYTLPDGENYREMLIKAPKGGEEFGGVGAHFNGEKGILASMRLKDRTGPNGEKLLHLEELQSDWHQQGREHGYHIAGDEGKRHNEFEAYSKELAKKYGLNPNQNLAMYGTMKGMDPSEVAKYEQLQNALIEVKDKVPDAPFKKNWEEMALKRLIHHAAEKGYHGIVVTPGSEQAKRYDLSKHINDLQYDPQTKTLTAWDHSGNKVVDRMNTSEDQLADYIGKEGAQKLLAQNPQDTHIKQLFGADLQVGGEGMKAFYDKKVPNILNAIGKKHGVKTQLHSHEHGVRDPNAPTASRHVIVRDADNNYRLQDTHSDRFAEPGVYQSQEEAQAAIAKTLDRRIPVHHFPITEEMRKDVLTNGLPLHKEGGIIHKAVGGQVQPSINQMRMSLMANGRSQFGDIQNIGANEAPGMDVKAYINPDQQRNGIMPVGGVSMGNQPLPIGGVDMSNGQPGQQLMPPGATPQPPVQPGQPGASPLSAGPSSPTQQPPSNILQMTPQGQALNAMTPPQHMADGGEVDGYASKGKVTKRQQTVKNAQRMAYPGIYGNPAEIAALAASRVAPEDPLLKQLFGVTRADMYQQAHGRQGAPHLGMLPGGAANPKGSMAAEGVMNKRNEQRLIDVMAEAKKHQGLVHGMEPWYYMDPLFDQMVKLVGLQKATEEYKKMNALMGMASSSSEVNTEIPRGSLAYYLQNQGRFDEFVKHGGKRDPNRPSDFGEVPGHLAHKTAHALPMKNFLTHGSVTMESPKVPMYIEASGVPATGFQTRTPVGDAHWSRAVGLADTRNPKTVKGVEVVPGASVSTPEMSQLGPWWQHNIASKLGLESVPAQALAWGSFSPQTGVTTPIGAPKLELIAKQIGLTAQRLGVSPQTARDLVLTGKERMGKKKGGSAKLSTNMDTINLELMRKPKKAK